MKIKYIFSIIIILSMILGWSFNDLYHSSKRDINGLWMSKTNITDKNKVVEFAKTYDTHGEWVCVNIRGMKVEDIINTCQHEAGHEIFAQYCEKDINKCLQVIK